MSNSKSVLVIYGTTEGHTRSIAHRVAGWLEERGLRVTVADSADLPRNLDMQAHDAYVLLGSLHETKHQAPLVHFARDFALTLSSKPSLFISASLTATSGDEKHQADARRCIDQFLQETGWTPTQTTPVAGALLYTKYNWMKRALMRMIVSKEGGDIDTSQDYEYTNWDALRKTVDEFASNHLI